MALKVEYLTLKPNVASTRLRAHIPARELVKHGVEIGGGDVLVAMKHGWSELPAHQKLVFDVCDDHFNDQHATHYRKWCDKADAITCNSEVMQAIIKAETGRDAVIIKEPYEGDEGEPDIGPHLYWFGHQSNLPDIERIADRLQYPLLILSNHPAYPAWTPETHKAAIAHPCIIVIPTGKSQAKSENRMVEAIRAGRYVACEDLPAYRPFYCWFPLLDMNQSIQRALDHKASALEAIREAQEYIRVPYSPEAIGKQWHEVLTNL